LWPYIDPDKHKAAELQWRFSIPLMVMILTLIAVPLSRVNPRTGKYANLLPAILIYVLYANFMFVARNWIIKDQVPVWLGMFWLHILAAGLGGFLLWRNRRNFA
jgi:lipopolysaccharide export system permease protein